MSTTTEPGTVTTHEQQIDSDVILTLENVLAEKFQIIATLEVANTALLAALEKANERMAWLQLAISNMPDLSISFTDDDCTEDSIGIVPQGWNIRCDSVCAEPLTINAPTLDEAIDAALALAKGAK